MSHGAHDGSQIDAVPVRTPREIRDLVNPETDVVGIDEVHFLDPDVVDLVQWLADRRVRVIVAGQRPPPATSASSTASPPRPKRPSCRSAARRPTRPAAGAATRCPGPGGTRPSSTSRARRRRG